MTSPTPSIDWSVVWETELREADHRELAAFLLAAYQQPKHFHDDHSWAGGRPELRLIGRIDGAVVAHLGIARRHLRVVENGAGILVGDVGLVGTDIERRGQGLGVALLERAEQELAELGVAFGMLNTGDGLERFYRAGGWLRAEGTEFHSIGIDGQAEVWHEAVMYLPVTAAASDWPDGVVQRNQQEL